VSGACPKLWTLGIDSFNAQVFDRYGAASPVMRDTLVVSTDGAEQPGSSNGQQNRGQGGRNLRRLAEVQPPLAYSRPVGGFRRFGITVDSFWTQVTSGPQFLIPSTLIPLRYLTRVFKNQVNLSA